MKFSLSEMIHPTSFSSFSPILFAFAHLRCPWQTFHKYLREDAPCSRGNTNLTVSSIEEIEPRIVEEDVSMKYSGEEGEETQISNDENNPDNFSNPSGEPSLFAEEDL